MVIMVDTPAFTSATTDMDTMVSTNVRLMLNHHMDITATDTQATAITDIMVDTLMSMSAVTTDITAMDTIKEFVQCIKTVFAIAFFSSAFRYYILILLEQNFTQQHNYCRIYGYIFCFKYNI